MVAVLPDAHRASTFCIEGRRRVDARLTCIQE